MKLIKKKKTKKKPVNVVVEAIRLFKKDEPNWKDLDQDDLYGIESYIDGLLYEKKYAKYGYIDSNGNPVGDSELILERLVFAAIKRLQGGTRHTCDPQYDDAFGGRDGY